MTEQVRPMEPDEPAAEDPTSDVDRRGPTTTGIPAVDEAIADVDRLDETPLEEHLEVFERAHGSLRAALDARPGDDPGDSA